VAVDLLMMLVLSGDEMLVRYQERFDQVAQSRRRGGRPSTRGREDRVVSITGVNVDAAHLAERLGLFVIIVLGEGVVQVVDAASEVEPDRHLLAAGFVSFVLLAGMFGLSVQFGHAGVPHLRGGVLPVRVGLVLHLLVTAVLACVAVGLAAVVEHGSEPLEDPMRWLLCGAVAAYFAVGLAASLFSRGWRPMALLVWVLTGLGVPLLLGLRATEVSGTALVAYVALVVLGHLLAEHRADRHDEEEQA
jgi:low temperature requirement protein LtrA